MLRLKRLFKNYTESARAFAELVPWMCLLSPSVVINKDGSLLCCFQFEGIDAEGAEQHTVDRASHIAEHALRVFDERFTIWMTLDRRRSEVFPGGEFANGVSRYINQRWEEHFFESGQYANRHYLSVLYTPPGGLEGIFEKIAYYVTDEEMSLGRAIVQAVKASILRKAAFRYESQQLLRFFTEFQDKVESFTQTAGELGFRPLEDEALLGFLHRRATPGSIAEEIRLPSTPAYLDSYLAGSMLVSRGETLLFRGPEDVYVAGISVKDWPDLTYPGMIDGLMAVRGEITISQVLRVAATDKSRAYIQDVERHNRNMVKSFKAYMMEAFTHEESRQIDAGRLSMAEDANDALTEMTTANRVYGHYNLTILTFGQTEREAGDLAKMCHRIVTQQRFMAVRESMHLLSCFAGSMPGQAGALVRWHFVSTANLCDLAPVRGLHCGNPYNLHLSEQAGRLNDPVPALTALPTEFATPFYFSFHQGDLAHALVLGPSRQGKSTFDNFLIAQHQKHDACNTFIFDKDFSCRIATIMQGGQHINISQDGSSDDDVRLNPLVLLKDRENWGWIGRWLEILLTARGYQMTSDDDRAIAEAIHLLHDQPQDAWRLGTLATLLPTHLHDQLQQWIGDGPKAGYFDNIEDSFSLSSFTCIEMGSLFKDEVLARAFVEYAFHRISLALDGRPTLIYIEEAWFMLAEPRFAKVINDWLRTLAKRNAWVLMATQSLDEIARSDIFATIIDNIPTRIFLPNPNAYAHADMYREQFGLNDAQIDRIQAATGKRHYYITTPTISRMVEVSFPPDILAILRSDSRAQKVFDRHYATRATDPDWHVNYIEEMVNA